MASKKISKKKWTFMVYLAGDNNLDQNGVTDLDEMKRIGSTDAINIIAQFDRAGEGVETKRYFLRRGTSLSDDAVTNLGETNTGNPQALVSFIRWGIRKYPAERYAIVLWNHGQGWDDTDIYTSDRHRAVHRLARGRIRHAFFRTSIHSALFAAAKPGIARAILLDDNAKDFLDNVEMKKALIEVKKILGCKIDVLGMDACLMSMAEVAYQVRDSVDFIVGSEQTEPLEGWPYHTILDAIAKNPVMGRGELAAVIVEKYLASYTPYDNVTQSALDLARSESMVIAITALAKALSDGLDDPTTRQIIMQTRVQVQSYEVQENIDLVDFCLLLKDKLSPGSPLALECRNVIDAIADSSGIITKSGYKGTGVNNSHGLAIYFPTIFVSPLYAKLDFAKKTGWGVFLSKYVTSIRIRPA